MKCEFTCSVADDKSYMPFILDSTRPKHRIPHYVAEVLPRRVGLEGCVEAANLHACSTYIVEETAVHHAVMGATADVEADGTKMGEGASIEGDRGTAEEEGEIRYHNDQ